jgi:hypothetical protein
VKKDPETEQVQLGTVTLDAVDRLTGMTADEIERVAEQVLEGAEETAAILRELARRVRENGMFANERLARFVRVANQCADIARSLQQTVERRDEQSPPEPKTVEAKAERWNRSMMHRISARSSSRSSKRPSASGAARLHDRADREVRSGLPVASAGRLREPCRRGVRRDRDRVSDHDPCADAQPVIRSRRDGSCFEAEPRNGTAMTC